MLEDNSDTLFSFAELSYSPSLLGGFYPRTLITNLFSVSLPLVLESLLSSPDIPGATYCLVSVIGTMAWAAGPRISHPYGEDDMNSCCSDDGEKRPLLLLLTPQLKN